MFPALGPRACTIEQDAGEKRVAGERYPTSCAHRGAFVHPPISMNTPTPTSSSPAGRRPCDEGEDKRPSESGSQVADCRYYECGDRTHRSSDRISAAHARTSSFLDTTAANTRLRTEPIASWATRACARHGVDDTDTRSREAHTGWVKHAWWQTSVCAILFALKGCHRARRRPFDNKSPARITALCDSVRAA